MKLSILIPTYNRGNELLYNLKMLEQYIVDDNLANDVNIIVSNNASTDNTKEQITDYLGKTNINIIFLDDHKQNIGLEANALYVLQKATAEYIMYLGDDDYLDSWYIKECLSQFSQHPDLGCIIPNYIGFDTVNQQYDGLREENCETRYDKAGFHACIQNTHLGHQLSGLCFIREGLYDAYRAHNVHNIYPFVFFVAYTSLHYDVLHFGQRCLTVSGVPQSHKDWNYGDDGLMNDYLDNIVALQLPLHQRIRLERKSVETQMPRAAMYPTPQSRNTAVETVMKSNKLTYIGKYFWFRTMVLSYIYTGKKYPLLLYPLLLHRKITPYFSFNTIARILKKFTNNE